MGEKSDRPFQDDSKPMSIYQSFKRVKQTNPWIASSLLVCKKSECNKDILESTGLIRSEIAKAPLSFNNLLWPRLGKEKRSKVLQIEKYLPNLITREYDINYIYEFLGQPLKNSKNIWIEFQFLEQNVFKKCRLTFDLAKSTIIGKLSDGALVTSAKMELKQKLIQGQPINITITGKRTKTVPTFWINGEPIDYQPQNFFLGLTYFRALYGGKWRSLNTKESRDLLTFPRPESPDPRIPCDEGGRLKSLKSSSKLSYKTIDRNSKNPVYLIDKDTVLKPNKILEFEIRDTLCPTSTVARYQFQPYMNGTEIYYNLYSFFGSMILSSVWKAKKCMDLAITFTTPQSVELACEKDIERDDFRNVWSQTGFLIASTKDMYLLKGPKRTFQC